MGEHICGICGVVNPTFPDEHAPWCDKIDELQETIAELRQEVEDLTTKLGHVEKRAMIGRQ